MVKISAVSHQGYALTVLCLAAFLVPFMGSALNLALPEIAHSFSLNAITITWLTTAYLIPTAIFQIPFARLGDMYGRKRVYLWGIILFSVCTFLSGFSPTGTVLLNLRFLSGVGSAMMFGSSIAILTSIFPQEKRGRALAINTAVVYISIASGPLFGGLLTHYFGWQSLFFFCGSLGFISVLLLKIVINTEWIVSKEEKFDYLGSLLYGIGLFGLIYGFINLSRLTGIVWLFFGVIAFVVFVLFEQRCRFPVINIKLFRNRIFALSSLAALINYAATSAIGFMLSLYLQFIRGLDVQHTGFILITQAAAMALFSLVAGKLTNTIRPASVATFGMMLIVCGIVGLLFISPITPIILIICCLLLLGIGFGLFASPNTNIIMSSVDHRHYGQASATTGTMRLAGQAFSMGIAGMAISLRMGTHKIVPELYPQFVQSMRITFIIFIILCMIGVYASSARSRRSKEIAA
ncbi:MAG: MFS transporter [Bacteroidales bacterium]|jgi:MFS family permease|nr:MFS transporter [Bacteroidales bacterium]